MNVRMIKFLCLGGISVTLFALGIFGVFDIRLVIEPTVEWAAGEGVVFLCFLFLCLYGVKGFLWWPPFLTITILCSVLPWWIGLPIAVIGHAGVGHTVCWFFGTATTERELADIANKIPFPIIRRAWNRLWEIFQKDKKSHIFYCFNPFVPTDWALTKLKHEGVRTKYALLIPILFVIMFDTAVVLTGKGLIELLLNM